MYTDLLSSKCDKSAGGDQYFVLGPFLFKMYVNDVAENMLSIFRLFPDDSSLQQSSYNVLDIEYKLNRDLHIIEAWPSMWLLKFNPSKTKVVIFQGMLMLLYLNYFFQDDRLERVPVHCHLGLL